MTTLLPTTNSRHDVRWRKTPESQRASEISQKWFLLNVVVGPSRVHRVAQQGHSKSGRLTNLTCWVILLAKVFTLALHTFQNAALHFLIRRWEDFSPWGDRVLLWTKTSAGKRIKHMFIQYSIFFSFYFAKTKVWQCFFRDFCMFRCNLWDTWSA